MAPRVDKGGERQLSLAAAAPYGEASIGIVAAPAKPRCSFSYKPRTYTHTNILIGIVRSMHCYAIRGVGRIILYTGSLREVEESILQKN